MKRIVPTHLPRMRQQGLVIDELPDEVLVYDLDRNKAHCLNRTAAFVWQHCDGQTTPQGIARLLAIELQTPISDDIVWFALLQLEKLHLLEEHLAPPAQVAGLTRRQLIRGLGIAAATSLPVVISLLAPTPAQASTCIASGSPCNSNVACCLSLVSCTTGSGTCL